MLRSYFLASSVAAALALGAPSGFAQTTVTPNQPDDTAHSGSGTPGVNTKTTNPDQTGSIPSPYPLDQTQQGGPAPHPGSGTPGVNK